MNLPICEKKCSEFVPVLCRGLLLIAVDFVGRVFAVLGQVRTKSDDDCSIFGANGLYANEKQIA